MTNPDAQLGPTQRRLQRTVRADRIPASWWSGFAATLLVLAAAPVAVSEYNLTLLLTYALLALSLAFVWGVAGILCFGQAAFYGLGAYTYAVVAINMGGSTLAVVLAITVAGCAALALGAMMFYSRMADVYLGVITLVATLLLFKYANSTAGQAYAIGTARLGGFNGIPGFPVLGVPGWPDTLVTGMALYFVGMVALLLCWLMFRWLAVRPFGRLLAGIRENELRAELSGHDVRLAKTLAFGLGGAVAGLAGVLYACWAEIVTPEVFSLGVSAEIIIWVLVGGLGTLWGPMFGAVLLGALKGLLGSQQWMDNGVVMGLLLVVVVLFLPSGLLPSVLRGVQYCSRRAALKARHEA
ncbi:branched-chain amino acid ABC transporter permease [Verminephrobacter eiseniae]|uniref:Inner-membrane translocator n=1 Tax=Verminephrobacter eiseniae (strain EF01-2) TaxID=391735 RepID=A1WET4_VEREI|nr:branched-chain amino acid ABC transporter permease [Verminephrobacter eiseniae]ABM56141.1 inner-membrane translocator [Verminephrobacter eiseniae EF01-2]MCW5261338.1 branched-chain amino acid ABC transporter permease [Verminephrobacter eiseniae]MCW5286512.1 branched-chain amino acid ABC transporter permease [Verminephrobacter eiseniae]MCW5304812.1 branched-chain amino acid ABC transporter permease [Verminephrobacter eiseniae]MCW8178853.1 branched-chain amino acid ABC transporter permease [V